MKRNMDLARNILLTIEASDEFLFYKDENVQIQKKFGDKYTLEQIHYNLLLLREAGFVEVVKTGHVCRVSEEAWKEEEAVSRLTWDGHEFLDVARDPDSWNQAKRTIFEKGGNLTLAILRAVLAQIALKQVS